MPKSYQNVFSSDVENEIERIAGIKGISGRAFVAESVISAVEAYKKGETSLVLTEYVFKMKDGSFRRGSGMKPGNAWANVGYKMEQIDQLLDQFLPIKEAREAGWDFERQGTIPAMMEQTVPGEKTDDLPFGK